MNETITLSRQYAEKLLAALARSSTVLDDAEQEAMLALIVELAPDEALRVPDDVPRNQVELCRVCAWPINNHAVNCPLPVGGGDEPDDSGWGDA